MTCEECLLLLEELSDGELGRDTSARVVAHAAACAACAAALEQLARERDFYLGHAPEVLPSEAFWEGVSARIMAEAPTQVTSPQRVTASLLARAAGLVAAPRFSPALTAAAVLVAVALTFGLMRYAGRETSPPSQVVSMPAEGGQPASQPGPNHVASQTSNANGAGGDRANDGGAEPKPVASREQRVDAKSSARRADSERVARRSQTPEQLVREAEQKYLAAIALLSRDARRTHARLDPAEAARFRDTLAGIDRAIDETRRAARRNPRDPLAAQYMLAAYAKKVDLLRDLAAH